jgi:hypothetical protein
MSVRSARRQPLTSPLLDDASTVQTMDTEQERELLFTPAALTQKMSGLRRVGERAAPVAGSVAAFAFTLNYIFGAGVLSLPHTVANAGVIGCAVFMIFTSLVSAVSMIWLTEVCGRAEALTRCAEERAVETTSSSPLRTDFIADRPENAGKNLFRISSRRLEVNQLSELVLGKWAGRVYSASVTFYSLGSMWFYGVIFARSLTETFPLKMFVPEGHTCDLSRRLVDVSSACHDTYLLYIGIFLLITMFASMFDLSQQKKLQTGLSALAVSEQDRVCILSSVWFFGCCCLYV